MPCERFLVTVGTRSRVPYFPKELERRSRMRDRLLGDVDKYGHYRIAYRKYLAASSFMR